VNTLGLMLLGSIVHATAFAALGISAYLALRRWGPAAGSLAAGSCLLIMVAVSMVAMSPWPRWWTLAPESQAPAGNRPRIEGVSTTPKSDRDDEGLARQPESTARAEGGSRIRPEAIDEKPALWTLMLEELKRPGNDRARGGWGWPGWLALGFFASMGLGLARLGVGLWGIARLRARSLSIEDRELDDAVEIIRAELSCSRRVEVRELAALSTPATIGWRRPLLLLPGDWREWSADERRAVVAHELAHVLRGDFLSGLLAQVGLALHFYHPLAHWLAARLRLEQELAADAWGARLSGGKPSYLATLARMALRRDGRAMTWPARAFLPSHGTFVRRIEMLRNTKRIRPESPPVAARVLTVAVLAALGLLIAGLRGPVGESSVLAQGQPEAKPADAGAAAGVESYNLAFLPADTKMVLAVRPGTLLRRRDLRSLVSSIRQGSPLGKELDIPFEDIEQILVFWTADFEARRPRGPTPFSGIIVRMAKSQDWKAVLGQLVGPNPQEARHAGQAYLNGPKAGGIGIYTPDDRTLVAADEDLLRELIEDRNAPAPRQSWDEAWKKVSKGQVMVAFDTRWLRRLLGLSRSGAPGQSDNAMVAFETFAPLLEKARSYAAGINASDTGLSVDLVAMVSTGPDGETVAETMRAVVTLGKNFLRGVSKAFEGKPGPTGYSEATGWMLQAGTSLLDKARVETSEGSVRLHAESSVDLAEGIKLVVPVVTTARAAARRAISVNNLKQIGLAFHNYHQVKKDRFPSAVNHGGASGKVPYSWRVAILPYLEQQELYNQYNFDEPWDGPNNRKLIDKMPAVYGYPGPDGSPSSQSHTSYFVFTGPSTALSVPTPQGAAGGAAAGGAAKPDGPVRPVDMAFPVAPSLMQFTDGTSNTILAVEAKRDVPWTKPEDIPFDPNVPLPELGGFTPDGFNALFADGSVRYLKKLIAPTTLKALITRDGGEVLSNDSF
jgi:prepilin-type processing-associated H-X9-DG protein